MKFYSHSKTDDIYLVINTDILVATKETIKHTDVIPNILETQLISPRDISQDIKYSILDGFLMLGYSAKVYKEVYRLLLNKTEGN